MGLLKVSVVIPVYNECERITKTLRRLSGYLKRNNLDAEIIIVDDGSKDGTRDRVEEFGGISNLKLLRNQTNHGKGFAVRQGVLAAHGDYIFFTDADLSTPPHEIGRFLKIMLEEKADVLAGSRSMEGAKIKVKQPCLRRAIGRTFNGCVKWVTSLQISDTQCGFKAFRKDAAKEIFSRSKENGFTFDVEILLLARRLGLKTKEVPITWVNHPNSRIQPFKDGVSMFLQLLEIRKAAKIN